MLIVKPCTSMPKVACESKLPSLVRYSIHPCPGNWVAIERPVVYYVRATQAFSAEIKCLQCNPERLPNLFKPLNSNAVQIFPAPVDRTSASAWLYKHSCITLAKRINDPPSLQINVTFS